MSNQTKQISIRSIESIVPKRLEPEQTEEVIIQNLQQKIQEEKKYLQSLQEKQNSLIQETKEKIATAQAQWQEEKKKLMKETKQVGYRDGYEHGKQEGYDSYKEKLIEVNNIVDATIKDYHSELDKSTETILGLSVLVAERIIENQLTEHPSQFLNIVKAAVHDIKGQPKVSIILHPTNYELVSTHKTELQRIIGKDSKLAIYVNEDLKETDCLIEHPFGQIEANIDSQLTKIREALMDFLMETKA
ncbi:MULTISPECIES: flagellar assembly protein FliH [Oceanobacillus]|uniref:flagellar assembly protein FliH n=1 Tax=Oceanobacillus TaxID=182709 RepID=UPI00084E741D|nr:MULTISPECIES: flagellar assembly protein FliH [Oceanobacillus]MBT2598710.1 flagellar assembly protein FliH [Oceanobacillus sp. ISL-74]MBT2651629.1 flagellar assembly protein FliH [Oceanobacillus sp. ISL-73]OEH54661.1 flagellar assembly protein FliH [Oceanobacillus sp. E9]